MLGWAMLTVGERLEGMEVKEELWVKLHRLPPRFLGLQVERAVEEVDLPTRFLAKPRQLPRVEEDARVPTRFLKRSRGNETK